MLEYNLYCYNHTAHLSNGIRDVNNKGLQILSRASKEVDVIRKGSSIAVFSLLFGNIFVYKQLLGLTFVTLGGWAGIFIFSRVIFFGRTVLKFLLSFVKICLTARARKYVFKT